MAEQLPPALQELAREMKAGYKLERTGSNHFRVRDRYGHLVEHNGKNVTLSGTSHGGRGHANNRAALKGAGVLRGTEQRVNQEAKRKRDEAHAAMHALRAISRQREIDGLHDRLADLLRNVGSLEMPGMLSDLSHVGVYVARQDDELSQPFGQTNLTPDLFHNSISRVGRRQWVETRYQAVWNALCARLEDADDTTTEWFQLIRAARNLPLTVVHVKQPKAAVGDWPFTVELVRIGQLVIDHSYQRPAQWPFIRAMAAGFDETLVGTIDVSARHAPAVYAVLDGQLRLEACKLVGKQTVWASVYQGMSMTDEARFFLKKNSDRKAIHPYYTFRARMTAGDPEALEINEIVEAAGYEVTASAAKITQPATINNIPAIASLEAAYRAKQPDGTTALRPTLEILRASTYGREQGQAALLIKALGILFSHFGDRIDTGALRIVLEGNGPVALLGRASDLIISGAGSNSKTNALVRVLLADLNRTAKTRLRMP